MQAKAKKHLGRYAGCMLGHKYLYDALAESKMSVDGGIEPFAAGQSSWNPLKCQEYNSKGEKEQAVRGNVGCEGKFSEH